MSRTKKILIGVVVVVLAAAIVGANLWFKKEKGLTVTSEAIKTRDLAAVLGALEARGRILLIAPGRDERLELSARNLPTVEIILADSLNVVDLLKADIVLIEQPSLARMQEVYA